MSIPDKGLAGDLNKKGQHYNTIGTEIKSNCKREKLFNTQVKLYRL
jgi:hypothetical protein